MPSSPRRQPRVLALVIAAGVALTAACGTDSADPAPDSPEDAANDHEGPIRMNSTGSSEELVMWIADAEGIFDEHDLDVEISDVAGAGLTPIALTNEEVELGIQTAPDFLQAVDQGLPLTAAAGLSVNRPDNPRLFVVAGSDSGIDTPADLEGARIGTPSRGGSFEVSTVQLVAEHGVDAGSIDWVEVPFAQMQAALDSGTVDAVATSVTLQGALVAAGHAVVLDLSEFGDDVLVTFLTARQEWAARNPAIIDRVRSALDDAATFAENNPERAIEIIVERTGLPPEAAERIPLPTSRVDIDTDQVQLWIDAMRDQDMLENDVDPAELIVP
ncbi:ABC transporter substrate-binding protein [Phytoactinopolyspora limicola]|uniref:ABC transporter substrate-binding protein n=1 Tax=Phytoactinopolyspora limicola TaxID=2715536 RepID=UPI00140B8DCE|nr:ABC transporter substrate-binding protein [Phytoactinopolyspora limicola]